MQKGNAHTSLRNTCGNKWRWNVSWMHNVSKQSITWPDEWSTLFMLVATLMKRGGCYDHIDEAMLELDEYKTNEMHRTKWMHRSMIACSLSQPLMGDPGASSQENDVPSLQGHVYPPFTVQSPHPLFACCINHRD